MKKFLFLGMALYGCLAHAQTSLDNDAASQAADAAFFSHPPTSSVGAGRPAATPSAQVPMAPYLDILAPNPNGNNVSTNTGLPWPIEGHSFTLAEISKYRDSLAGKVVWVRLSPTSIAPEPDGLEYKLFVRDAESDAPLHDGYGFVWFPKEGAQKMNLIGKTMRGWLSFYVKVDTAKLTAIGRSKSIFFNGNFAYVW